MVSKLWTCCHFQLFTRKMKKNQARHQKWHWCPSSFQKCGSQTLKNYGSQALNLLPFSTFSWKFRKARLGIKNDTGALRVSKNVGADFFGAFSKYWLVSTATTNSCRLVAGITAINILQMNMVTGSREKSWMCKRFICLGYHILVWENLVSAKS